MTELQINKDFVLRKVCGVNVVLPAGQAAASAPRAIATLPSDEQTVYCPTAHSSQKNGKINV